MVSTNCLRRSRFASVSRSVAWIDFFKPQTECAYPSPDRRPAQPNTALASDLLLQLGDRDVRMFGDQLHDKTAQLRVDPPLRSGSVTPPLHLPALRTLTEDLLHIPKAYTEHFSPLAEAPLASSMRLEYLHA